MKKLVYLFALTALAAGCVVEVERPPSCDPAAPCIVARIALDSAGPGTVTYQTRDRLRVNAQLSGTASGFIDIYNPDVRSLQTPPLTAGFGFYDVWIDYINDAAGPTVIVDTTETVRVDVDGDLYVDAELLLGNGFLLANWSLTNSTNNMPYTSCSQIPGQNGVSILGTLQSDSSIHEDIWNCADGFNMPNPVITDPNPIGNYVVAASLIDINGDGIGQVTTVSDSIVDGNDYTDLGVVDIRYP